MLQKVHHLAVEKCPAVIIIRSKHVREVTMQEKWEKQLSCASSCQRCGSAFGQKDERVLSVFDHQPICMKCKQTEEKRPDYEDRSKQMLADCIGATGKPYGDPAGYCFHHFCPFKCKS
jgi:hypothetical protein